MGALHFGLDPVLLEALRRHLPLKIFVETGTYQAETTAATAPLFDRVYTVELSPVLYEQATRKLAHLRHVEVIQGSSPEVLRARGPEFSLSSVLYWLDAHWCGGSTGGAANECPLLGELAAIGDLNDSSVVLIDDARYFLGPPPAPHNAAHWPGLFEVEGALRQISGRHKLWIVNDVIIYAPNRIANDVVAYGRAHGIDLAALVGAARNSVRPGTPASPRGNSAQTISDRNTHGLDLGFNRVLLAQHRSERIFAFHAGRIGITRLLDVGSNSGQFAAKMRRFGFDGVIYSVEPQIAAHRELCKNAQSDVRWIPLPRQAAGRVHCRLDLNLSQNSWSSSFFPVHENHLRAAPETRTVAQERVFVTKTADLLRGPLMQQIDALKIDVQGYELEVLEGLRSYIDGIQLILLEMSLVECYVGAPNLFVLDRLLVEEFGFARISLEPSYYDDEAGVVQQFDGIYARSAPPNAAKPADKPYVLGAIVTSMHGTPSRVAPSGEEYGRDWLDLCVQSWLELSDCIVSVSESAPLDPRVRWIQTNGRPSIADLFAAMPQEEGAHTVLCNADIVVAEDLKRLCGQFDPAAVYMAHRVEVELNNTNPELLDAKSIYRFGFDLFLLPPEFVRFVCDSRAFPPEFHVGEPWWDYLLALLALAAGFPVKRLPLDQELALHYSHPIGWDRARWLKLGEAFFTALATLKAEFSFRACDLFDDIAELSGPLETRLHAVSQMVSSRLP